MARSPEDLFRTNCVKLVSDLASMTKVCVSMELASGDHTELEDLAESIDCIASKDLVLAFIRRKDLWTKITQQDENFMRSELSKVFSEVDDLDVELLMTPVRIHFEIKDGKHAEALKGRKNPVDDSDVQGLWLTCKKLVRFAWKYFNANGETKVLADLNYKKPVSEQIKSLSVSEYDQWIADFEASFAK